MNAEILAESRGDMPGGIKGDMPCLFGVMETGCVGDIMTGVVERQ